MECGDEITRKRGDTIALAHSRYIFPQMPQTCVVKHLLSECFHKTLFIHCWSDGVIGVVPWKWEWFLFAMFVLTDLVQMCFYVVIRGATASRDGFCVSLSYIRAEWKDMRWVVFVFVDALDSVAWWSCRPVVTICAVSHCYWPSALPLLICISSMSQWRGAMTYGYGNEMKEGLMVSSSGGRSRRGPAAGQQWRFRMSLILELWVVCW